MAIFTIATKRLGAGASAENLEPTKAEFLYRGEHPLVYNEGETFCILEVNRFEVETTNGDGEPWEYPQTPYFNKPAECFYFKTLREAETTFQGGSTTETENSLTNRDAEICRIT